TETDRATGRSGTRAVGRRVRDNSSGGSRAGRGRSTTQTADRALAANWTGGVGRGGGNSGTRPAAPSMGQRFGVVTPTLQGRCPAGPMNQRGLSQGRPNHDLLA